MKASPESITNDYLDGRFMDDFGYPIIPSFRLYRAAVYFIDPAYYFDLVDFAASANLTLNHGY